jgi:hypothetical protein
MISFNPCAVLISLNVFPKDITPLDFTQQLLHEWLNSI